MENKLTKAVILWAVLAILFFGCRDAFHSPEYDPGTATFNPDGVKRTVTFNANGGSGSAPSQRSAQSGETILLPYADNLTRTGYTFEGWNTNAAGTGSNFPAGSTFTVPNQDVALFARWNAVGSPDPGPGPDLGPNPGPGPGGSTPPTFTVSNATEWNNAISAINAGDNNVWYTITITNDFSLPGIPNNQTTFSLTGLNLIIQGSRTISLSSSGSLLSIGFEQNITVRDINLRGMNTNNAPLVYVSNGSFTMLGSASINSNTANSGAGIYVLFGTLTMRDSARVNGNTALRVQSPAGWFTQGNGAGVYLFNGTFNMWNNASVSGNIADFAGSGVVLDGFSTFFMYQNASVSDNSINNINNVSGAVALYSTNGNNSFTMQDNATVSNNQGGGVFVASGCVFTMRGNAFVSGNTNGFQGGGVSVSGQFILDGGSIFGNSAELGGGIFLDSSGSFSLLRGMVYGTGEGANSNSATYGASLFVMGDADTYSGISLPYTMPNGTYTDYTISR